VAAAPDAPTRGESPPPGGPEEGPPRAEGQEDPSEGVPARSPAGAPASRPAPEVRYSNGPLRWLLLAVGLLTTGLAILGAFLPVLPTTPFLILAAACFVRSSPAFHQRLLANRLFGPYLSQWQHDHTVPRDAKRKAYGLVVISFGLSMLFVDLAWMRWTLATTGAALVIFLLCLPTTPRGPRGGDPG